uniref:Septin-11 n=1 Tax=Sphaerodactylus townsendi TaxID=933632 RepID=A0ACB8E932_9SAUR
MYTRSSILMSGCWSTAKVASSGFGNTNVIDRGLSRFSYKPIVEYIDAQFEAYLQEELKIKRSLFNYHDTRIHACLYFIAPTGHSLKSLDLVTMKKLDSKVNIIPIIAKADTIAKNELHKFKSKIMSELVSNGVQIYQFPTDEETVAEINATMSVSSERRLFYDSRDLDQKLIGNVPYKKEKKCRN